MERLAGIPQDELVRQMQAQFTACMEQVRQAVNAAPEGRLIEGSEVQVHTLMRQLEQQVYQTALQARVGASEAAAAKGPAAFSPSGPGAGAGQGPGGGAATEPAGVGEAPASSVYAGRRQQRLSGRRPGGPGPADRVAGGAGTGLPPGPGRP
jgi:hypothetical protein